MLGFPLKESKIIFKTMFRTCCILCFISVICSVVCTAYSQCNEIKTESGTISDSSYVRAYGTYQKCWTIHVPESKFITLKGFNWNLYSESCSYAYLKIQLKGAAESYQLCGSDSYSKQTPITAFSSIQIDFYFKEARSYDRNPSFSLSYEIKDVHCMQNDSFKCSTLSCIPKSKVCDGIKDCENGLDEVDCYTGILKIGGVSNARNQAIAWLKSKHTSMWGWHENTPRAVTALYLSNGANFNGSNLQEELMVKQSELKIAVGLLKDPIPREVLSIFINSLLVTCHSPRHFYGQNLLKRLKELEDSSANFTHPIVYLTLCNANESWPQRASNDLDKIFNSKSEHHFVKDIQSYAVMAVACYSNNSYISNKINITNLTSHMKRTIENFKKSQLSDGSFGNVQTTSLVTQALISSGQENSESWNLNAAAKYMIKELNTTDIDFSSVYSTLPVFNGKSLTDIFKVNCTGNPRRRTYGSLKSEIDDYGVPKVRIEYSLFVGEKKDIIHRISLRVPENYSVYQVMRYAAEEDYKYKFESKIISSKIYIYKVGKIINEPELGKFWLLYLESPNSTEYKQTTSSPDQITLNDEAHIIMWYKTATI